MSISARLGCSTISFRHLGLAEALAVIDDLGFTEVDLGALPGVCDHVPYELDSAAVEEVSATVTASGLGVRSVNGDIGDLNALLDPTQQAVRAEHLERLLDLTSALGAAALVLPNGALNHRPVGDLTSDIGRVADQLSVAAQRAAERGLGLWVESLHVLRLCHTLERAQLLTDQLSAPTTGIVMDFSHVVASGSDLREFIARFANRIRHVHLRDATVGDIHRSIGNGVVDFAGGIAALKAAGYTGHFTLELETRDITHDQRPAATAQAAGYITSLLHA